MHVFSLGDDDFKTPVPPVRAGRKSCVKKLGQLDLEIKTNDAVVETLKNR